MKFNKNSKRNSDIMKSKKALNEMQATMRKVLNKEIPLAVMIGYDSHIEELYKDFIEPINNAEYELTKMELREQLAERVEEAYKLVLKRREDGAKEVAKQNNKVPKL